MCGCGSGPRARARGGARTWCWCTTTRAAPPSAACRPSTCPRSVRGQGVIIIIIIVIIIIEIVAAVDVIVHLPFHVLVIIRTNHRKPARSSRPRLAAVERLAEWGPTGQGAVASSWAPRSFVWRYERFWHDRETRQWVRRAFDSAR
jgi:hypothetical protein